MARGGATTPGIDRLLYQQEVAAQSCIDKVIASSVAAEWQVRHGVTGEAAA
jgi:hypothetical protein